MHHQNFALSLSYPQQLAAAIVSMEAFSSRWFTLMVIIACLVWSSSNMGMGSCNARTMGKTREDTATLYKKKGKSHGSTHQKGPGSHKSNTKPPSVANPPPSSPVPSPKPDVHPSPPVQVPDNAPSTLFNVLDFGAQGDGTNDDTEAFKEAWAAACKVEGSTIVVPSEYEFLVGPISFAGPYCQQDIIFQLDGTIMAPTDSEAWGSGLLQWLEFTKLVGITIQGQGTIDGRGSVWWEGYPYNDPVDDEAEQVVPLNITLQGNFTVPMNSWYEEKMPRIKPTALRFYGSFNVTVTGITIQNSPQCHLKFDNCVGVFIHDLTISSPGDSPNTDGIHLQNSRDVLIRSSNLGCGDDCVSIQTGCTNVYIHNVNCGPGHGISIGSLGRDGTKACVSNITVRDVTMKNTMNGARIKTWQGGSGSVSGVLFSNIQVSEVEFPIVIDQYYCDKSQCKNQTSAVSLSGITFERIKGSYTVKPVHLACSDHLPCVDVTLTDIELTAEQENYHMYDPFCWQSFGMLFSPTIPPIDCLQLGKPSSNQIQGDHDSC